MFTRDGIARLSAGHQASLQDIMLAYISDLFQSGATAGVPAPTPATAPQRAVSALGDATPKQAADIVNVMAARTRTLIQHAVTCPEAGFEVPDLAAKMGLDPGKLGGAWGGFTKASRRIVGNALITWTKNRDGSWRGRMSPVTRASFRAALGL